MNDLLGPSIDCWSVGLFKHSSDAVTAAARLSCLATERMDRATYVQSMINLCRPDTRRSSLAGLLGLRCSDSFFTRRMKSLLGEWLPISISRLTKTILAGGTGGLAVLAAMVCPIEYSVYVNGEAVVENASSIKEKVEQ